MEITIKRDLDIKALAAVIHEASKSIRTVEIEKDGQKVDFKSILGVVSLGLKAGDTVTIRTDDEIVKKIIEYLLTL